MKRYFKKFSIFFLLALALCMLAAAVRPDDFDKYEIVSTKERTVAGVDAKGLMVYAQNDEKTTAYDLATDSTAFSLGENYDKVAPFFSDGTAVITGKEGYASAIVSRDGTILAQLPEGYIYSKEFGCGFICLIDKNAFENVYTIIDRSGKIIVKDFYATACELKNGDIIIRNAGGGYSRIKADGTVKQIQYLQSATIEDAVSLNSGVYVDTEGCIYSSEDKPLYKNSSFDRISPINEEYALGVKINENSIKQYIIDIKAKKETELKDNGLFDGYIFSKGNVCDGKAFVGNGEKSVLVNLKTGNVLSDAVADYSDFYKDIATIKTIGENGKYRFMKCDGTLLEGEYDFASNFEYGYSVTAQKASHLAVVSIVNENGKKMHLESLFSTDIHSKSDEAAYNTSGFERCKLYEVSVQKLPGGNIYVENRLGSSYIFAYRGDGNPAVKAVAAITALVAAAIIILNIGYTLKRVV